MPLNDWPFDRITHHSVNGEKMIWEPSEPTYAEHQKKFKMLAVGTGTNVESLALPKGQARNKRVMSKDYYDNHINILCYWNVKEDHKDVTTGQNITQAISDDVTESIGTG